MTAFQAMIDRIRSEKDTKTSSFTGPLEWKNIRAANMYQLIFNEFSHWASRAFANTPTVKVN